MHIYPPVPALLLAAALFLTGARAEALEFMFSDDFERLPPASEKLNWFLEQLVPGEPITDAEILENFAQGWFSGFTVQQTRDFLLSVRASYPSGEVTDQISLTPIQFVGMVTGTNGNEAFVIVE